MKTVLLMAALAACGGGDDGGGDPLTVTIESGTLVGTTQEGARAWLGIPFAAPPVGPNRFRPPQPVEAWDGPRDAVEVGSACPQSFALTGTSGDEDCLYLNVWAPPEGGKHKAVMVWIHGGAFIFGSGGDTYYSGKHLAATRDVVVVSINYRLGAFGFMAHPAFAAEDPGYPSSGNWGFEDQRAALEWVQRNIEKFGGDPANVTLFGESAGGWSTCAHYLSPRSQGLFARVISQSGLCSLMFAEPTKAEAEAVGLHTAETLGCTGAGAAACLRAKSVADLLKATALAPPGMQTENGGPFYASGAPLPVWPNVDGVALEKPLRAAWTAGDFDPKPILIGGNLDEGTLFQSTLFANPISDEADYRAALARRFGAANVDAIVARYPVSSFPDANRAAAEVSGDSFFACALRRAAREAAKHAPVYMYSFEKEVESPFLQGLGVFHSSDIPFTLGVDLFPLGRVGASGAALADQLEDYWTSFAKTGDPNHDDAPAWPQFSDGEQFLRLGANVTAGAGYKGAMCDFWDAVVPPSIVSVR